MKQFSNLPALFFIALITISLTGCVHSMLDSGDKDTLAVFVFTPLIPVRGGFGQPNGGREGVDQYCAANIPPNLSCSGGLHAFITIDASDRAFTLNTKYTNLPEQRPIFDYMKRTKIAENWADFTDGSINTSLAEALNISYEIWSGADDTNTCNSSGAWTSSRNVAEFGISGSHTATDGTWFNTGSTKNCNQYKHVLCICWDD